MDFNSDGSMTDALQKKLIEEMGPAQKRIVHETEKGGEEFRSGTGQLGRWLDAERLNNPKDLKAGAYSMIHPKIKKREVIRDFGKISNIDCPGCQRPLHNENYLATDNHWIIECSNCLKIFWIPCSYRDRQLQSEVQRRIMTP